MKNAETLALRLYEDRKLKENYTYYGTKAFDPSGKPLDFVQYLNCTPNKHFHGEAVNTSFSSIHIPTYIYHRGESAPSLPASHCCVFVNKIVGNI